MNRRAAVSRVDCILPMRETDRGTAPGAATAMDTFSHPPATSAALDFARDGELRVVEGAPQDTSRLGTLLLGLLRSAPARPPRPDLAFGREVAQRVLVAIAARGVAGEEANVTPGPGELGELLAAAATMALVGRSLLDEQVLAAAWSAVATAACEEAQDGGMAAYLESLGVDPELGRLHVHLAERRHGGDHPLKFIGIRSRTIDIWVREGVLLPTDRFHVYLRTAEVNRRIASKLAR